MSSKLIGIVGWNTGENSFGITKAYGDYFQHFGDIIVLGPTKDTLVDVDLVVLPGGQDVSSHLYGERPSLYNTNADLMKEYFMMNTLPQYIDKGTPIFGICLGMQQINVHFGGKMVQEVAHPSSKEHRSDLAHDLIMSEEWKRAFRIKDKKQIKVNSLHRQGCDSKNEVFTTGPLEVVASYAGVPEIIRHRELPIWGVQYHPEEIYDIMSTQIVNSLLDYEHQPA